MYRIPETRLKPFSRQTIVIVRVTILMLILVFSQTILINILAFSQTISNAYPHVLQNNYNSYPRVLRKLASVEQERSLWSSGKVPNWNFQYQTSDIRYQISDIRHQISDIRYQTSDIRYQTSDIRCILIVSLVNICQIQITFLACCQNSTQNIRPSTFSALLIT